MDFAGLDLASAVTLASQQPARLLGLAPLSLEPGQPADLIQFTLLKPAIPRLPISKSTLRSPTASFATASLGPQDRPDSKGL